MLLYKILAYTIHRKICKSHTKTVILKYQLGRRMKFELPDGSYSILDIEDYFEHIINKHEAVSDNPLIGIYAIK